MAASRKAARKSSKRQFAPRPRARGPRQPQPLLDYIGELDQKGVVPKQILVDVKQRFPDESLSTSTLSRILKIQREDRRDGEAWSPRDAIDGVDVAVAIAALAPLISSSDGRRQRLTVGEAQRITFVRRAAPDIPIELAFRVAQMYGRTTPGTILDAYLAFAPWRGAPEARAYVHAIEQGWLPRWSPETLAHLLNVSADKVKPVRAIELESASAATGLTWSQLKTMEADEREALEAASLAARILENETRGGASSQQTSARRKGGRSGKAR